MDLRVLVVVAICSAVLMGTLAEEAAAAAKKLLVVSHTAGFRHTEGIEAGEKMLAETAKQAGVAVEFVRNADEVKAKLTVENVKKVQGIVFLNTTGDIGIPDLPGFLQLVRSGKGVIGIHAATDTYHEQPAFLQMMGGEFQTHGQQTTVTPIVRDPKHPAVKKWPAGFALLDEIYHTRNFDKEGAHVLLALDKVPDDGTPIANQPADFPLAWCKVYGRGRVFYTAFGHRGDVWEKPEFRQHLLGGIRWAVGLEKGDPKPGKP